MDIVDKILLEALGNQQSGLNHLCKKYTDMGCDADVYPRSYKSLYLSLIKVPQELRGQGIAVKFMDELTDYADKTGQVIVLSPSNTFGSSVSKLKDFYSKFGFKSNTGSKADHRYTGSMIRYPKNWKEE